MTLSTLPSCKNGRIDLHFNGLKPPRGKTRFGLVVDLERSKHRWNINFEKVPDAAFINLAKNPDKASVGASIEDKLRIIRAFEMYCDATDSVSLHDCPDAFIAYGRYNLNSGKPDYKLVRDLRVIAILDLREGMDDPKVALFWDDELHAIDTFWSPPVSSNPTLIQTNSIVDLICRQ